MAAPTRPGRESIGTIDELHELASRATGLDDFGADDYRTGLRVLLESYERDAGLSPWGNRVNRSMLHGALVARLLSEAAWAANPGCADVPIERPIFVTGLPPPAPRPCTACCVRTRRIRAWRCG